MLLSSIVFEDLLVCPRFCCRLEKLKQNTQVFLEKLSLEMITTRLTLILSLSNI